MCKTYYVVPMCGALIRYDENKQVWSAISTDTPPTEDRLL